MLWLGLELITLGTLSLYYYVHIIRAYSMLFTFVSATTANNIEPNIPTTTLESTLLTLYM